MNILFVADVSISKVIGGAERVLFEQSSRLAKRNHNVHILTRKLSQHDCASECIHGVKEWRYDINNKNAALFLLSSHNNAKKLFEYLHSKTLFCCIKSQQPFSSQSVLSSSFSSGLQKIYNCHSLSFEEFISRNPSPKSLMQKINYAVNIQIRKIIEHKSLKKSDIIIVESQFTANKLLSTYRVPPDKINVIPGGVDIEKLYPAEEKDRVKSKLGLLNRKLIFLTIRNLVPRMGLGSLIQAFELVVSKNPNIHLVIGGEGPLEKSLKDLCKKLSLAESITFTGFIKETDLSEYYRAADFFVLPTKELEGFGLVTLEAMASGVPVLGTPIGGTKEILGAFNPDFLFKDTTPEAMADLIVKTCRRMKENPGWWQDVSQKCRRFVEDNYTWERNVDAVEALFLELTAPVK